MKAVLLSQHGGPEVLEFADFSDPKPGPGEVLVKVRAVALNHLDLWVRRGLPHLKLQYPHILGSDVAGEIAELGPGVDGVSLGQKVLLHPGLSCGVCERCSAGQDNLCPKYRIFGEHVRGGYAEYLVAPLRNILPFPEPLDFTQAACLPLVFLTAWQMLVDKAGIRPGMTVVIHGGASGVGSAGVQIAKLHDCRVITTAGSDEKLEKAKTLGADFGINYKREKFLEAVTRIAGKQGVDVVFEHVGKALWKESLLCLKWGGVLVTCGATTGSEVELDLKQVFFRQLRILGSTMGSRAAQFEILRQVSAGRLKPVFDRSYPLREAQAAHRRLEAGEQFGKIVLLP